MNIKKLFDLLVVSLFYIICFFSIANSNSLSPELQAEVNNVKWLMQDVGLASNSDFADQNYLPPINFGSVPLQVKINQTVPTGVINIPCDSELTFSFDANGFISNVNSSPTKKPDCNNITFHSMHHVIVFPFDNSQIAIKNQLGSENQKLAFKFVTDPYALIIITVAFFTFDYKSLTGDVSKKWFYAIESNRILVFDETPPDSISFSDRVLFTTTGGKISEFNQRVSDYDFKHPNSSVTMEIKNPTDLTILVKDNNFFASDKTGNVPTTGYRYGITPIDLAIYVEIYKAFYKPLEEKEVTNVSKLDRILGETVDKNLLSANPATPEGKFGWLGPIWFSDLEKHGWKFDKVLAEVETDASGNERLVEPKYTSDNVIINKDKCCTVFIFSGPIEGLEKAAAEKSGDPNAMRYSFHFASLANMFIPTNSIHFLEHNFTDDSLGFKDEKMLRICVAVLDNSGNLRIPYLSQTMDDKRVLADFQAKYGASKLSKAQISKEMIAVIPYDDRLPNPILLMTNTETNVTTAFTIPNSDCLDDENNNAGSKVYFPYAEQAEVWHFKYDGNTDAMKWLKQKDPKRYNEYINALNINEDVRLIFDMIAHDNINKYFETVDTDKQKIGQYGISTEMIGYEKGIDNLHYKTWTIEDPTGNEALLYENKADNIFTYPDYVFRNPEPGKVYRVSFYVEDFSPFFNRKGSAVVPQPPKRYGNIRQIILEFNVKGKAVKSQSMGNTTTSVNKSNKDNQ